MTETPQCSDVLEHISAYLDQELDPDICLRIERHCIGCADCASLVAGLRETIGLCRAAGRDPLPPAIQALGRARVAELLARNRSRPQ